MRGKTIVSSRGAALCLHAYDVSRQYTPVIKFPDTGAIGAGTQTTHHCNSIDFERDHANLQIDSVCEYTGKISQAR